MLMKNTMKAQLKHKNICNASIVDSWISKLAVISQMGTNLKETGGMGGAVK